MKLAGILETIHEINETHHARLALIQVLVIPVKILCFLTRLQPYVNFERKDNILTTALDFVEAVIYLDMATELTNHFDMSALKVK